MKIIIGIHGLANKPEPAELELGWKNAIAEGLQRNRYLGITPDRIPFESVFWADVTYGNKRINPDPQPYERSGTGPISLYRPAWVQRAFPHQYPR